MLPRTFCEQHIQVYYKKRDAEDAALIAQAFQKFCENYEMMPPKNVSFSYFPTGLKFPVFASNTLPFFLSQLYTKFGFQIDQKLTEWKLLQHVKERIKCGWKWTNSEANFFRYFQCETVHCSIDFIEAQHIRIPFRVNAASKLLVVIEALTSNSFPA